jgi:Zn-dependent M28 family amino/carboxypeptidase
VESRESHGGVEERAAEKAGEEIMRIQTEPQRTRRLVFSAISAISAISAVSVFVIGLVAQTSKTRAHVETLASSRLEGRLAGSNGERLASDYLVAELKKIGALPLPGQKDIRLPFEFTAGTKDGGSSVGLVREPTNGVEGGVVFSTNQARALSFSDNGDVTAPVVFAGYGIVVPESQNFGYDSYAMLDVKDKVVLVLRYFPEEADQKTRGILARYADLRYKAMAARQHGAKAMLVVTGPQSPNAGELAPMTFDTAIAGSGIVAVSVTGSVANALFTAGSDKALADVQKALDSANPHVAGFALPGVRAQVHAAVEREKRTGHNVVAYLPATDAAAGRSKPWVAIGAHYDHLGHGEAGNTLAGKDDAGKVHAGADDNASGSAAVLAIAATLAKQPRHRNVLVGFWSGEELGLIGSSAFANAPPVPLDAIAAYLNFDMVGRMQDNKLTVQATGTSPSWAKVIEQANVAAGFDLAVQEDPYQPTDVATFNAASIPSLSFFTGAHADYHKPSDTADKIDYEDLDRVVDFAAAIVRRVEDANDPPRFTKVEQQMQSGSGRAGVRIFTGTIPDYSTDVKGLLLGGVVGGGPAEQAGLQKGDVIVEIAGQTIANIYDYTYALDILKIGQPSKVVYMRDGKRHEATLTPAARK